jgi:C2 domain
LDEFINNYFEKQTVIKERIIALEEQIKGHQKNKDQLYVKLKELKGKQKTNPSGIDIDAVLSLRIVEGRDLKPMDISGKADPYCVIKFGT